MFFSSQTWRHLTLLHATRQDSTATSALERGSSPTREHLNQMHSMSISLPPHLSPPLPHSRTCPHTLHEGLAEANRLWPGQPAEKLPLGVSWMNLVSLVFLNTQVMLRLEHPLVKSKLKGDRNEQASLLIPTTFASQTASSPAPISNQHHLQQQI